MQSRNLKISSHIKEINHNVNEYLSKPFCTYHVKYFVMIILIMKKNVNNKKMYIKCTQNIIMITL